MDSIRVVPDPLVFPHYGDEWAPEQYMAVTPGQTLFTSVNVQCFGGGSGRGGVYSLNGITGKVGP